MMRIAIVGAGITGLSTAWLLSRQHEVTLFEAEDRLGGHSNTVSFQEDGRSIDVDTGFIVYNEQNYPNLVALFDHLEVPTESSDMSFAVSADGGRFEYAGSLPGLVAQRRNLLRPRLWRMTREILRFYREAEKFLEEPDPALTITGYLDREGYSQAFRQDHLLPMAAAIWSSSFDEIQDFPAVSFLQFFRNHGLLKLKDRPQWRTVSGGSRSYVERMAAAISGQVRTGTVVQGLERTNRELRLTLTNGEQACFDQVVLACHADQARRILGHQASPLEGVLLNAFRYEKNRAVLHQDTRLMPRNRRAWASWNYISSGETDWDKAVSVTYWMNRLQNLQSRQPVLVSLNPATEPDPRLVIGEYNYSHPLFDAAAITAQQDLSSIQGRDRVWFCGSYCGYGFHEDGLQAGLAVAAGLGCPAPWAQQVAAHSPALEHASPEPYPMAAE
ncbi:NAD(P)/FAD-dependent oxidoreductase [Fodinicurvata sediminis]|uniref:NAD(P)/FAD-dependent oxidoreductase n=1 Tax=Fodinicurvata sediminis TaxID=1121832 RepID=UPI0003B39C5F|nr:FAD-dependent oxidoreductase [Fodinicurvata sediminis]